MKLIDALTTDFCEPTTFGGSRYYRFPCGLDINKGVGNTEVGEQAEHELNACHLNHHNACDHEGMWTIVITEYHQGPQTTGHKQNEVQIEAECKHLDDRT